MIFPTELSEILQRVSEVDPIKYGKTRNFKNGAVSSLSPYISRGVISTRYVYDYLLNQGYTIESAQKFFQELAWRDYFQLIWKERGEEINHDLRTPKYTPSNTEIPSAIVSTSTGIDAIDAAIDDFYRTGYLHNHMRMYIASVVCSVGKSNWKMPAKWMYYHLLDADWASNALSWQWVAGTNSNKMYFANQDNINKYWRSNQKNTILDFSYAELMENSVPDVLKETEVVLLETKLPEKVAPQINVRLPSVIYTVYNLDPFWLKSIDANRILLLEPGHFKEYPMGQNTIDFVLKLAENIVGIQVFSGEFDELQFFLNPNEECHFKEHPLNNHFKGVEHQRDWMFPKTTEVSGSFFKFWKTCLKSVNG